LGAGLQDVADYAILMAGHTGQSSQLFPVTTGRDAQFLATVARHLTMGKQLNVLGYESRVNVSKLNLNQNEMGKFTWGKSLTQAS
jgi:hypothetical protein